MTIETTQYREHIREVKAVKITAEMVEGDEITEFTSAVVQNGGPGRLRISSGIDKGAFLYDGDYLMIHEGPHDTVEYIKFPGDLFEARYDVENPVELESSEPIGNQEPPALGDSGDTLDDVKSAGADAGVAVEVIDPAAEPEKPKRTRKKATPKVEGEPSGE